MKLYYSPTMITKKQLEHGLEWISGKTKISLHYGHNYLDVNLYPNYPKQSNISLFLRIEPDNRVKVIDLVGNNYYTDYRGCGYGTLIFNIGIQALYAYYGITMNDLLAKEIYVYGETSPIGDPDFEPDKSDCRDRRNKFWGNFGLIPKNPKAFRTPIEATLADLHLRDGEITANGTSRIIEIEKFWLEGNAPPLFKSDIQALMAVDLEQFNLESCPTKKDIRTALDISEAWSNSIRKSIFLIFSFLSVYWAFRILEPLDAIAYSLLGFFLSHFFAVFLSVNVWKFSPVYNKYERLLTQMSEIRSGIRDYIIEVEESHNGLLWRLYHGIKDYDESLSDNIFNDMAKDSKAQYAFKLADRYKEYKHFVEVAKNIIIEKNLNHLGARADE